VREGQPREGQPFDDGLTFLETSGIKNKNEYECWECKETTLPDKIYTVTKPDLSQIIAQFCANRECNLLHAIGGYGDYVSSSVRGWTSWKDRSAYSKMPPELINAYEEACKSFLNGCYIATMLVCRTMIIHTALDNGYEPTVTKKGYKRSSFKNAIKYLDKHLITSNVRPLNKVCGLGNEAAHELINVFERDALMVLITLDTTLKEIYFKKHEIQS